MSDIIKIGDLIKDNETGSTYFVSFINKKYLGFSYVYTYELINIKLITYDELEKDEVIAITLNDKSKDYIDYGTRYEVVPGYESPNMPEGYENAIITSQSVLQWLDAVKADLMYPDKFDFNKVNLYDIIIHKDYGRMMIVEYDTNYTSITAIDKYFRPIRLGVEEFKNITPCNSINEGCYHE